MDEAAAPRLSPSRGPGSPDVWGLHDPATGSVQYVLACPETRAAAIVDPVLDYLPSAGRVSTGNAEALLALAAREGLRTLRILDTHPHADHMTASAWLAARTGAPTAIGARTRDVARLWAGLYNLPALASAEGYDAYLEDGAAFELGALRIEAVLTPGHTMASVAYACGDAMLVHDTLMQPDSGTSRADFPGGSAEALWDSIQTILARPPGTRLFIGHDYRPGGRPAAWESTVAEQREANVHVGGGRSREAFLELRRARDATLPLPERMLAALQVNLRGGRLPEPEGDGHSYLKIPLDRF